MINSKFKHTLLHAAMLVVGFSAWQANAQSDAHGAGSSAAENWALLDQYCMDCHNVEDFSGGLALDLLPQDDLSQEAAIWEETVRKLRGRLMPPPGSPQPSQPAIDSFVGWMEAGLDAELQGPAAGHVPLQRLSRYEYEVAVESLLGVDIDAAEYLPADIEMDGFDNIAQALTTSPSYLEQYVAAARNIARQAVGDPTGKLANVYYALPSGSQNQQQDGLPLGSRGGMRISHDFPADGEYLITIPELDVGLYPRGMETENTVVVLVDGKEVFRDSLGGLEDLSLIDRKGADGRAIIMARFSDIPVQVTAGRHDVVVTFVERSRAESSSWVEGGIFGGNRIARMLDGIGIVGPYESPGVSMSESRQRIFSCYPEASAQERECAEQIAAKLASEAYRRPASLVDVDRLMPFYEQGSQGPRGFDGGVEQMVAAVLASPDFLFRSLSNEKDVQPNNGLYALNDLELASRLSFFLWSQGPDETLRELAVTGQLQQPGVLAEQAKRMLADPKAQTLVDSFALKWLNVDDLDAVQPDGNLFRGFTTELREDFSKEISLFLESILLEDRPVTELLTAEHSFLNERLARHYDIDGVFGPQFRRVDLTDARRHGLLGKAAVLMRTSYGDRTSPVLRGAWVLEKIVGAPPTPPPPNVETDLSAPEGALPTTVRARLEQHRDNPGCNQCHGVIDPLGLALENYTVTGQWREIDQAAGQVIDASTVLPNGQPIEGPVDLRESLMERPEQFVQSMTEKLMMYAINREPEYFDMPQIRQIVRTSAEDDYRFSSLVLGIVNSDAFRYQEAREDENVRLSSRSTP